MFYVGTSGYAFKEWKGPFYPAKLPDQELLPFYSSQFNAVEINNTFYRLPREKNLVEWAAQVPAEFRFAIKASQRITHHHQLVNVGDLLGYLLESCAALGEKLGPTLFQLPPHLQKDVPRLTDFLATLPRQWKATMEFRHPSWFDDDVFRALEARAVALCISDQEDLDTPFVVTAPWGYVRLHQPTYDGPAIARWAERLREPKWTDAYVFFKHDHGPESGPPVAKALVSALSG
jgi:uncharacterized protein YecE (DUF72 family)